MADIIISGRVVVLIVTLGIFFFQVYYMWRAKKGHVPQLQRLPAVDALEEGVGRAVEMGRPVHFVTTMGELQGGGTDLSEKVLGYYVMEHVAEMCASQNAQLYVSEADPLAIGYIRETLRSAYEKAGWPEGLREDMIAWFPWTSMAFALPNWFQTLKPGANYMMGNLYFCTVIVAEAGALGGAFQVGYGQTEFLIASCEYVLIADEYYATTAYLSKKPSLVAGIAGNDYVKMLLLTAFVASLFLFNIGIKDIVAWLKL